MKCADRHPDYWPEARMLSGSGELSIMLHFNFKRHIGRIEIKLLGLSFSQSPTEQPA